MTLQLKFSKMLSFKKMAKFLNCSMFNRGKKVKIYCKKLIF